MSRIAVVDDEPAIAEGVAAYLRRDGHAVEVAASAPAAIELGRTGPDLMILDLMLGGGSGFDVLRTLRGEGRRVPVIILSARVDVIDRVAGLELGADDYITKPFEPRELVARVGAVLRRAQGEGRSVGDTGPPGTEVTRVRDLVVSKAAREVRRGSTEIALTRTEFELLVALAEHPGHVMSREQLASRIFGGLYEESDRTVDSHVRNLRHKLGAGPDGGEYVETVRGVGYRVARGVGIRQGRYASEMTHLYTVLVGGRIARGGDLRDATALVVAADTVLFVGTDEEAAAVSRGDSMTVELAGAEIVATGDLEVGSPADFDVVHRDGSARVRGGRLVAGALPGWHDHGAGGEHDHGADGP